MNAPVLHRAIDPAMLGKIMRNPRGCHPRLDGPARNERIGGDGYATLLGSVLGIVAGVALIAFGTSVL